MSSVDGKRALKKSNTGTAPRGAQASGAAANQGIKVMQIATMTELSYPTVRAAIDLFNAGDWSAIRPARRGRPRDDGRVLSQAQENMIPRMIIDNYQPGV